jgi:hypothetical protein
MVQKTMQKDVLWFGPETPELAGIMFVALRVPRAVDREVI